MGESTPAFLPSSWLKSDTRYDGQQPGWCGHFGEQWQFLKKLNTELPYDPATLLLGRTENSVHTKTCT